jgi:hypothetical protein
VSIIARILDWFDAPRYCKGCGEAIEVEQDGGFDPKTGKQAHDKGWAWHCPEVSIDLSTDGTYISYASWRGGGSHDYGTGRPRWHKALGLVAE